jgi:hypothetical protein
MNFLFLQWISLLLLASYSLIIAARLTNKLWTNSEQFWKKEFLLIDEDLLQKQINCIQPFFVVNKTEVWSCTKYVLKKGVGKWGKSIHKFLSLRQKVSTTEYFEKKYFILTITHTFAYVSMNSTHTIVIASNSSQSVSIPIVNTLASVKY